MLKGCMQSYSLQSNQILLKLWKIFSMRDSDIQEPRNAVLSCMKPKRESLFSFHLRKQDQCKLLCPRCSCYLCTCRFMKKIKRLISLFSQCQVLLLLFLTQHTHSSKYHSSGLQFCSLLSSRLTLFLTLGSNFTSPSRCDSNITLQQGSKMYQLHTDKSMQSFLKH